MILFTAADVQARLSDSAYKRLFAKNGGSAVDATFLADTVADANSLISTWCKAAFPPGFDATGGTVDRSITMYAVRVCCYLAASNHPSTSSSTETMAPYRQGYDDAEKYFKRLNRDEDARPVTAATGRALPRARAVNLRDEWGTPTNPLVRAADLKDPTGF